MTMRHQPPSRARGFTLIELIISLVFLAIASVALIHYAIEQAERATDAQIARQTRAVSAAAQRYLYANHDSLMLMSMPAGTPYVVTTADLIAGHYLQGGTGAANAFGQQYELRIIKVAGQLQPLILSVGGKPMDGDAMRRTARMITLDGGAGGFIDTASADTPGPTTITGGSGWRVSTSDYGLPGGLANVGHIADALFFTEAAGEDVGADESLHRTKDPANPQFNEMETDLDMNGHRIVNARSVSAQRVGVAGQNPDTGYPSGWSGGVHTWDLYAEGSVGVGSGGDLSASIDKSGNFYSRTGSGWFRSTGTTGWYNQTYKGGIYMTDSNWVRVYGSKGFYTAGQIRGGTVRADGRLDTKEFLQVEGTVSLNTTCPTTGLIARASGGAGMAQCRGGKWQLMQGISDIKITTSSSSCNAGTNSSGSVKVATCPANYKITGGGYYMNRTPSGSFADGPWAPRRSSPSGNGWAVQVGGHTNACFVAYAVCAR